MHGNAKFLRHFTKCWNSPIAYFTYLPNSLFNLITHSP